MELIEFEWFRCRAGYRLVSERIGDDDGLFIESIGGDYETYRPAEHSALFQEFADASPTAEGMLEFIKKFGHLEAPRTRPLDAPKTPIPWGKIQMSVGGEIERHADLRKAISFFEADDLDRLVEYYNSDPVPSWIRGRGIRPKLRANSRKKLQFVLEPSSLYQFLWLQFAEYATTADVELLRCEWCKTPFLVGPGTGRRDTAKFCSNACKAAEFRSRRAG
jgi:hypothetical protein